MGRKKHRKMDMMSRILKPVLAASTHILTVGGVIVATSPVLPGVQAAVHGDLTNAPKMILYNTTGADPTSNTPPDFKKIVGTLLVVGTGVGLIAGGAYLRKRIGRTH